MSAGHTDPFGIEYLNGLYSYSFLLTRNHAEAEDLVQETYVRAITAMDRLRPDTNTKAWLFTILRNVWLNRLRKLRNSPHMVPIEADDEGVNSVVESSMNPHDLVAAHGKIVAAGIGVGAAFNLANAPPANLCGISVLLVAGNLAGAAADALCHVEVEAVLLPWFERPVGNEHRGERRQGSRGRCKWLEKVVKRQTNERVAASVLCAFV
jgi:RNA polymerase sigma factor (sigma-70 family)